MRRVLLDPHFANRKRQYAGQTALATLALAVVLVFSDVLANAAIVTVIASTTFLVFVNPGAPMAQPRQVVGGHAAALLVALAFSFALNDVGLSDALVYRGFRDGTYAVAVSAAILLMAVTDTEHAPAAGTVLGLVIEPWSLQAAFSVACAAVVLSCVKVVLRRFLVDLL